MKPHLTLISIALALAFGAVQAQSTTDGTSNTLILPPGGRVNLPNNPRQIGGGLEDGSVRIVPPAGSRLTTNANVSGAVSQGSSDFGFGSPRQTAAIGSANGVTSADGSLTANGSLVGNLSQNRVGNSPQATAQTATIGSLAGNIGANSVHANGVVQANLEQLANPASASGQGVSSQTIDVGGISDSGGGSLVSNGVVTGAGITQIMRSRVNQEVRVGSIVDSSVQSAQTNGTVAAAITQSTSVSNFGSNSDLQRVGVGDIRQAQATSITTQGSLTGALTQSQSSDPNDAGLLKQSVEIGSVSGTAGGGTFATQATVSATLSQSAAKGTQQILVGSVEGGAPTRATTRATLAGGVSQTSTASAPGVQTLAVGSVRNSTGSVSTDATVDATVTQTLSGTGDARKQTISIASADGTQGDVTTKATVAGTISQSSQTRFGGLVQGILVGSAVNTGSATVRTNATVSGSLSQSASSDTRANQNILIGSVSGASQGGN